MPTGVLRAPVTMTGAGTRLTGVIGHPVAHSLSPAIHAAALRHDRRDGVYLAFDVHPARLPDAISGLGALGCVGINVTVPHKVAVLEAADTVDDLACRVGAANTLVFGAGGVSAHNTDVAGFCAAVQGLGLEVEAHAWLILGAGGAARAVAWAGHLLGAGHLLVANRNFARARDLVAAIRDAGHDAEAIRWERRREAALRSTLIVNATSVGMEPGDSPMEPRWLGEGASSGCRGVLDLVYGAEETSLTRSAREAGLVAADGLEMLVYQAAEAYRFWWGDEAPVHVMRQAAWAGVRRVPDGPGSTEVPPVV